MTCIINNRFQHVKNYTDQLILNILEVNLKSFFENAFLQIGGWTDINANASTIYDTLSPNRLTLAQDPSYTDGCVWQSFRKDWVWENVSFSNQSPIDPVIKVNNNIANNFNVDYINGRVIFNNPLSQNSIVTAEYSYRNVQIYRSSDAPWWQLLQYGSLKPLDISNSYDGWNIGPHHRIQLPCIVIDSVPRSRSLPHELGSKSMIIEQDIIFNVIAENKNDRNQLLDIIRLQQENTIWLYNINNVARDDKLPINYLGAKNPQGLSYNNIINEYKWAKTFIKNINLAEVQSLDSGLYEGLARGTFEIIFDSFYD